MEKSLHWDDLHRGMLLPPWLHDWLPEKRLVRFLVNVVAALDLSAIPASYQGGRGRDPADHREPSVGAEKSPFPGSWKALRTGGSAFASAGIHQEPTPHRAKPQNRVGYLRQTSSPAAKLRTRIRMSSGALSSPPGKQDAVILSSLTRLGELGPEMNTFRRGGMLDSAVGCGSGPAAHWSFRARS